MNLNGLTALLADAAPATGAGNQSQGAQPGWTSFVPLLLMMIIMLVLFMGPQRKKARDHAAMINSIKPGDKVVTSSGIVGIIVSVKDKTAAIRSADTKLEIQKSAIAEITERSGSSGES